MNIRYTKRWLTSGIALALVLGGGAMYAYADDNASTSNSQPPAQVQPSAPEAGTAQHGQGVQGKQGPWKGKEEASLRSVKTAADVLGMKPEEIMSQLKQGKSLADIAQAKGISENDLIAKLKAASEQKLDTAVKAGKITQEKADAIKQKMADRIKQSVERKGLPKESHHHKGGHDKAGMMSKWTGKAAGWFNMSEDQLKKELKSGKSLAEVAQEHGMTKDQLIAKIKDEMTPVLDKMVTRKHTADKQDAKSSK